MQNETIVLQYADAYSLDRDWSAEQIRQESNGNPLAVSYAGAQGIAQLMPATQRRFGVSNPFDIYQSLDAWGQYMTILLDMFGGDYLSALAGYNAGEGTVKSYLTGKPLKVKQPDGSTKTINSKGVVTAHGIPPYTQTIDYVNKIASKVAYDQSMGGVEYVDGLLVIGDSPDSSNVQYVADDNSVYAVPGSIQGNQDNAGADNSGLYIVLAAAGLLALNEL